MVTARHRLLLVAALAAAILAHGDDDPGLDLSPMAHIHPDRMRATLVASGGEVEEIEYVMELHYAARQLGGIGKLVGE